MASLSLPRVFMALALCSAAACGDSETPDYDTPDAELLPDSGLPDATLPGDDAAFPDGSWSQDAQPEGDAAQPDGGPGTGLDPKPKCVKKDSQVLVVGDSYINWISHSFPEQLKTVTGQNWRMLAIGGTAMGSGGIGRIPDQFHQAIKADPDAHTILMDGGGNDILVPDFGLDFFGKCKEAGSSMNPNCQKIVTMALDAAADLLDDAVNAGIRDVMYFFYPHIPENRLIGGPKPNEILDYSLPMVKAFCDGVSGRTQGKLRCHFIDMIPVFKGHTPGFDGVTAGSDADWFNEDIHPNSKGSQGMVDHIWSVMKAKCIGQKDATCCEP